MKDKNKIILELIIIFILTILFNLICNAFERDEMWNYGFAYNIATGLIPYKDFNMVITPLFPALGAIFLYVFGTNIVIYYIFNSLICTSIFYYLRKNTPDNYYVIYMLLLPFSTTNYNLFCILLLYIIIDMEDKNKNDYLIGIILGLTFLTKQNIGIYLCIPTLFIKDIKRMIKRGIGFLIPNLLLIIYLFINNCLYEFIDYVFLSLGSFAKENIVIYPLSIIIFIITTIYLIYKYIKTKDKKLIYLICFQGMAYPIFNTYHVIIPFIPAVTYFLSTIKLHKKLINISFIFFIIFTFSFSIYQIETGIYQLPNDTTTYKYKKMHHETVKSITEVGNYIKNIDDNLYIIDIYAYVLKLESSIPINKYDLLNDGNLGKDGINKIIQEISDKCQKEKCTLIMNKNEIGNTLYNQYNQELYLYVANNYIEKENISGLTIYKNY